ncbi:hypothetical protein [Mycoplasma sp. SG1]|uniref:hypothetical protein n=1 Tax=Mycoplasma sp. SG1 TaxID=2810348 RepID=UPI002024587F|nr:hypothetical protein [Mycoplasma sp. SG1]URM53059.1 hypothetical protein JRW51_01795 [Mycoplasma sp. SG1]
MITEAAITGSTRGPILPNQHFAFDQPNNGLFDPSKKADSSNNNPIFALFNDSRISLSTWNIHGVDPSKDSPKGGYYSLPNALYRLGHSPTKKDFHTVVSDNKEKIEHSNLVLKFGYSENLSFVNYQDPTSGAEGSVYGIQADSMTFADLFLKTDKVKI